MSTKFVDNVFVHPLVLLSVTDHYFRVAKDTSNRRVIGVLLGESFKGRLDITNSFALPFEEDPRDPSIFFVDHDYLENMYTMFKKISARERIVGFYSTGPKIRPCDLAIERLFTKYTSSPVMVIVDVRTDSEGLPTQAYHTIDHILEGRETVRTFTNLPCEIGAFEAEEVGVEQLLRDINDPSVSSLAAAIRSKVSGVKELYIRLQDIVNYLERLVCSDSKQKLEPNNEILYNIQRILARLPNVMQDPIRSALFEATNDQMAVVFTASVVRSVTALHDLVQNKTKFKDAEFPNSEKEKEKEKEKAEKEKDSEKKELKEKEKK